MDTLLSDLDWSALRHFYAVAHFQGFSRASRATGVSQPAISTGLKKLEGILETTLIVRASGEFRLTPEGTALYDFCRKLEGNISNLFKEIRGKDRSGTERHRIGTALSIGYGPLAPLFIHFAKKSRSLDIEVISADSHRLLKLLQSGEIDVAFLPEDVHASSLHFVQVIKDEVIMVGSPKHFSYIRPENLKAKLVEAPLIHYPRETPMRILVDRVCQRAKLTFESSVTVPTVEAVKTLCAQGVGVAFMQRSLASAELASGALQELDVGLTLPNRSINLATRVGDEKLSIRFSKIMGLEYRS